jgi:beta-D-xylosidase 4
LHGESVTRRYDTTSISGLAQGTFAPTPVPPPPPGVYETGFACNTSNSSGYKFCDTSLSHEERLADLVPRIKDEEIGAQLTARQSPGLERIGLPSYYWGTNAIHGMQNVNCLSNGQCPTSFAAPCALAAAFNSSLVYGMGSVIGKELRAYYNEKVHNSLDTWSPTININRVRIHSRSSLPPCS